MSDMIERFYREVFNLLNKNQELKNTISTIYIKPILDPVLPCILIEYNLVKNCSNRFQEIYEISFSINIIAKDKSIIDLKDISNKIIEIIDQRNFRLDDFEITGIKYNEISSTHSKDMNTTKLNISYNALIKKEIL
jgi:hypothetical protein